MDTVWFPWWCLWLCMLGIRYWCCRISLIPNHSREKNIQYRTIVSILAFIHNKDVYQWIKMFACLETKVIVWPMTLQHDVAQQVSRLGLEPPWRFCFLVFPLLPTLLSQWLLCRALLLLPAALTSMLLHQHLLWRRFSTFQQAVSPITTTNLVNHLSVLPSSNDLLVVSWTNLLSMVNI